MVNECETSCEPHPSQVIPSLTGTPCDAGSVTLAPLESPGPYDRVPIAPPSLKPRKPMGRPPGSKTKKRGQTEKKDLLSSLKSYQPLVEAGLARERANEEAGIKQPSERDVIRWVLANRLTVLRNIDLEGVPCREAVTLLLYARKNTAEFIRTFYTKLIPSQSRLEAEDALKDDGRLDRQLIEDWESSLGKSDDADVSDADAVLPSGSEDVR